jgi:hypothetical protein
MAWLNKAKIEPKQEPVKKEIKEEEPVAPAETEIEAPAQQPAEIPEELKPESAKFYEQQKPVVQQVMFLPLQPEMRELIVLTKQMGQVEIALGNMLNALVEGQKTIIANQEAEKKLLEMLIKEIELASQPQSGM